MTEENRNLILFFAISMLIMLGYPYLFNDNASPNTHIESVVKSDTKTFIQKKEASSLPPAEIKTIKINSKNLLGTISTLGVKINDIRLKKYKKEIDSKELVSVFGSNNYYAMTGWSSDTNNDLLPDENTRWSTDSVELNEASPVTLTWDNGNGLLFKKQISVDDNYLITVTDSVENYGNEAVTLKNATKIHKEFIENMEGSMSFYEGPLGYINGKLEEISYENVVKKHEIIHKTKNGWYGLTEKYWLVAFIANQTEETEVSYKYTANMNRDIYVITGLSLPRHIKSNESYSNKTCIFTGAKEVNTLDMYENKLGIQHFDLAIDFGWLYILTKPLLYALAYTKDIVGNMGLGIILITLLIKLLLLPLANKSYRSMNRMKYIQPKIQELQRKYADDKVKLGEAVAALYQKEGVSPVGGCLPMLLQSPILFALYKVLYISIEMRQAPFIWWIHDLSIPDPMTILNLFGLIPIDLPGFLQIGIWPILMGLTMLLQQKMTPSPADPSQANMMLIMPIMFTFMFAQLPAGLIIYWTFSNLLGIIQQYVITKSEKGQKRAKS